MAAKLVALVHTGILVLTYWYLDSKRPEAKRELVMNCLLASNRKSCIFSIQVSNWSWPLKDICFPDTTLKISFKFHFKHDYVFNLLWLYSKEV